MCLAVTAYRKWDFRAIDVSRAFLMSEPLKRDAYVKLPEWEEKDNVAWELLKPLYGLSTDCGDWYKTIQDFLADECFGGGCVLPWIHRYSFGLNKGLGMVMGRGSVIKIRQT